ncbi:MAG: Stp1/IreP family PP2C-type Ser/Thr phosphatase [Actinomycetota bacterium]|nr:Stp1/IreP family PP2C-type Ser/Thr phosphatase [Actinomycetota bacterium]
MTLRVVEKAGLSDVGRQREANEDSYVLAEPVFVVADGMGGAQAGEVASRTAAEVFEEGAGEAGTPEERLTRLIEEANRRIHELSRREASRRGMGTTLTVAMLTDCEVSVGHVGDSRAYRLRAGELAQLTHDHSLVAELQRSGQLTAEAAQHHPQKSIITRALGPEPNVEVDAHTHAARDGDVYLLCSDGLTGMVSDEEMGAILRGSASLSEAVETLVRAANQSGGKDNITVVLFRVADDGSAPVEHDTLSGGETIHQGLTADDVQAAVAEQERAALRAPASRASSPSPAAAAGRPRDGAEGRRRGGVPRALKILATLTVLAVIGAGLYLGSRQVRFLGTDDSGLLTLYRGLPYELPLDIELYSAEYTSSVPVQTVSKQRRERLLDHEWRSREDAADLVRQLERGTLDDGGAAR